ncbi:hypothetical protein HaLaN_26482 [Haematococcus lacustris]|uniref:Uncharacterized protein n=1 Tax=Haematococcus lacustris TaxID=44745 RepID=A0A6A0A6C1_HAELA|nr:hypothetical protein HaLaN_26482 [Haematococcus lacustris]
MRGRCEQGGSPSQAGHHCGVSLVSRLCLPQGYVCLKAMSASRLWLRLLLLRRLHGEGQQARDRLGVLAAAGGPMAACEVLTRPGWWRQTICSICYNLFGTSGTSVQSVSILLAQQGGADIQAVVAWRWPHRQLCYPCSVPGRRVLAIAATCAATCATGPCHASTLTPGLAGLALAWLGGLPSSTAQWGVGLGRLHSGVCSAQQIRPGHRTCTRVYAMHEVNPCAMSCGICCGHAHVQCQASAYLMLLLVEHIKPLTWDCFAELYTGRSHLHGHMGQCTFRFLQHLADWDTPAANAAAAAEASCPIGQCQDTVRPPLLGMLDELQPHIRHMHTCVRSGLVAAPAAGGQV